MLESIKSEFTLKGFTIVKELFSPEDCESMLEHYMGLRQSGPIAGDYSANTLVDADPLAKYPRMKNMHEWDEKSKTWTSDARLLEIAAQLLNDKPVLYQTMLYFKPPGSRGQALHQDEQYISTTPLLGAWTALDFCDEINGCMQVVPGSHELDLLPVREADESVSMTKGESVVPHGYGEFACQMNPGDVLFFDGKTIHGSHPNQSSDRFRRSFICHFIGKNSTEYEPAASHNMQASQFI